VEKIKSRRKKAQGKGLRFGNRRALNHPVEEKGGTLKKA